MAIQSWLTTEAVKSYLDVVAPDGTLAGPFADDTAAAAGGVKLGQLYYLPAGTVVVRLV